MPVKASIREAIDIFYKVNASGVSLTEAELALAQISGYWPQARDIFKAKLTELEKRGYTFKLAFIVYARSEEHTSELQSPMRHSYAVFCLKRTSKNITSIDRE